MAHPIKRVRQHFRVLHPDMPLAPPFPLRFQPGQPIRVAVGGAALLLRARNGHGVSRRRHPLVRSLGASARMQLKGAS